ncbi:protein phosphatase 2C domain-containing protein [Metasolibacillus meyeri]|uniref:Protein phosphatase 2C domain-containing protein n=1 Tax=Metasolibacillus meyeri TaxID=1071052 RepID=A0AAW9NR45_9BACL|nr:protein phosphatase 2C domain-containing protein [Metasolibacillus meyeri]MEC1180045.1 protein phosphatase 2C domain-containing protein [Metasolibacillus meyeri]
MATGLHPYMITMLFLALLVILIVVRKQIVHKIADQRIELGNGQTIGRRDEQDDYFATAETAYGTVTVLADGISGLANGRMASTIAVTTFIDELRKLINTQQINDCFKVAATKSNQMIVENLRGSNGGTTLVAAVIDEQGLLYWSAVGDSVVTIFRNGEFIEVNEKHIFESVLTERYLNGEISQLEIQENPFKKRLVNYLGYEGFKKIDIGQSPIPLQRGDKVCLMSDGVYGTLPEVELEKLLSEAIPPHYIAQNIIAAIDNKRLKNQDNATIIILEKTW